MRVRVSGVFVQQNEILTMKYTYGGQEVYGIPGGGVDKGISVIQALHDEWKEELGVKIEVGNLIMVGEAPGDKRHPQTIHLIFEIKEVFGNPNIRADKTHSTEIVWLNVENLKEKNLYPDVGNYLYEYFKKEHKCQLEFVKNCMERGYF